VIACAGRVIADRSGHDFLEERASGGRGVVNFKEDRVSQSRAGASSGAQRERALAGADAQAC
jgi:hypothetical protein